MPTEFESISYGFYTAFFEQDAEERRERFEEWIKESTQVAQSAVEIELREYLEQILEGTWTPEGWKARAQKYCNPSFMDTYKLYLDIGIRQSRSNSIVGPPTPEVREKARKAAEAAKTAIAKLAPPSPIALREIDLHGNTVEEAIPIVEEFLRECYRDNVRRVRIIHGKGIFVLQKAIREYLGTHRYVKSGSISSADKDHGGEGATEATLEDFSLDRSD